MSYSVWYVAARDMRITGEGLAGQMRTGEIWEMTWQSAAEHKRPNSNLDAHLYCWSVKEHAEQFARKILIRASCGSRHHNHSECCIIGKAHSELIDITQDLEGAIQ